MAKITQKSMNAVLKVYRNQKTVVTLHMANPENPDEIMMEISVRTNCLLKIRVILLIELSMLVLMMESLFLSILILCL